LSKCKNDQEAQAAITGVNGKEHDGERSRPTSPPRVKSHGGGGGRTVVVRGGYGGGGGGGGGRRY